MNQDESSPAETVSNTLSETKERLRQTAAQVKEQAAKLAAQRKSGIADQIDGYREKIDKTAGTIEQEDPNLAWLSHQISERLRRASDYVRTTDFETMREDAEDIARRHPGLFFGGLFFGGLVIGNMLKATAASSSSSTALPRESLPTPSAYPETEDVAQPRDENAPWPEMPSSEAVK